MAAPKIPKSTKTVSSKPMTKPETPASLMKVVKSATKEIQNQVKLANKALSEMVKVPVKKTPLKAKKKKTKSKK